jgi:hypothetical protein
LRQSCTPSSPRSAASPPLPMTLQQVAAFLAIAEAMHNRSEEVIQALVELQAEIFTQQK